MWELSPQSIKTLIEEKISLPRFQRKSTWTPKQRFDLTLSFFNGFPLGTVVIKLDTDAGKFLLDGRQRRETLQDIRDPERVYIWARQAVGFSNKTTPTEIALQYYEYVSEYFGIEPFQRTPSASISAGVEPVAVSETPPAVPEEGGVSESTEGSGESAPVLGDSDLQAGNDPEVAAGIHELLDLILLSHDLRKERTHFVRRFDPIVGYFTRHEIAGRSAAPPKLTAESKALRKWILD